MHEAIPADENRVLKERREPIGEDTGMNEHYRLPVPVEFVLEFDVVECRAIHLGLIAVR
jgi:hypothetical protein